MCISTASDTTMQIIPLLENKADELLAKTYTIHFRRESYTICPKDHGYTFEWSNRKNALGDCTKNSRVVRLSKFLVLNSVSELDVWIDTILHEIAHAIDYLIRKKSNHDRIWKHIAKTIGADPSRTTELKTTGVGFKYTAKCPGCEKTVHFSRIWKNRKACGKCSPRFDERYVFVIYKNY